MKWMDQNETMKQRTKLETGCEMRGDAYLKAREENGPEKGNKGGMVGMILRHSQERRSIVMRKKGGIMRQLD